MNGYPRVKVNGFDFDSYAPVRGEVYDADKSARWKLVYEKAIEYLMPANVILLGAYLCKWWYIFGYSHMHYIFNRWAGWVMIMTEYGQIH